MVQNIVTLGQTVWASVGGLEKRWGCWAPLS